MNKPKSTLPKYHCSLCKKSDCKLWREPSCFALGATRLFCADCASQDQSEDISTIGSDGNYRSKLYGHTSQIGIYVPAIPFPDGRGYWSRLATPAEGMLWWLSLPTKT